MLMTRGQFAAGGDCCKCRRACRPPCAEGDISRPKGVVVPANGGRGRDLEEAVGQGAQAWVTALTSNVPAR